MLASLSPCTVAAPSSSRSTRAVRACIVQASAQSHVSRRDAALAGFAAFAAVMLPAQPAHALFGLDVSASDKYAAATTAVIQSTRNTLAMEKDDPKRVEAIAALRKETNSWVATYRRDDAFSGKPSYSNTYSAVNALAGHFNNFGAKVPLPAKRKDRILQELEIAEGALARGR